MTDAERAKLVERTFAGAPLCDWRRPANQGRQICKQFADWMTEGKLPGYDGRSFCHKHALQIACRYITNMIHIEHMVIVRAHLTTIEQMKQAMCEAHLEG